MFNMNIFSLFDFFGSEISFPAMIGGIVWCSFFFVLLLVGFLLCFAFTGKKKKQKKLRERLDFNVRIFSYNYATQTFYSFDKMNITNTKTFSLDEFYAQFTRTDKYLVEDWLRSIAHNEPHMDFLQADVILSSTKSLSSSMLELTSVNRQKATIHFVSHLLPNIYSINMKNMLRQKNRIPSKNILVSVEDAQKFMDKSSQDALGAVFYCKLYRKEETTKNEDQELVNLSRNVRLVISHFLGKHRKVLFPNPYDTILVDTDSISKISSMTLASTLHTQIQQYLNHNTNGETFQVSIGITNGTYYERNYPLAKEQAFKMAKAVQNGLSKDKVLFYDESFFVNFQQAKVQKEEISMVVRNATFKTCYTPALDITTGQTSFYMMGCLPYGTSVKDFLQVTRIAREGNQLRSLYDSLVDKAIIISKLTNQKNRIVINIPYNTINDFIESVNSRQYSDITWIFAIKETELLTTNDDASMIAKSFHDITKAGYQVGLVVESSSSGLRSRILRTMSYFFIPPQFTSQSNDPERSKTELRNIQNLYGNYRVPLVYYGLQDIEDIELGVHYGGTIFQCDELSLPSSHMESMPENIIKEVLDDTKNLRPKTISDLKTNHQ